jgi:hypothetical protein
MVPTVDNDLAVDDDGGDASRVAVRLLVILPSGLRTAQSGKASRRDAEGRSNMRVKCAWSAKPATNANSTNGIASRSRCRAKSSRRMSE